MKARKKDMSRANSPAPTTISKNKMNTSVNSNSDAAASVDSPMPKSSDIDDETGESGRSTPSRSTMDSPSKVRKRKKRKSGTYNLPSNKRIVKKKPSNPSESSAVDSDRQSASDKQSDNVVVVEDDEAADNEQRDSPIDNERLMGDTESVEESMDTDDKDTGLSDETGSEKGKQKSNPKPFRLILHIGVNKGRPTTKCFVLVSNFPQERFLLKLLVMVTCSIFEKLQKRTAHACGL